VRQVTVSLQDLLRDDPRNWGRWGPDDEVGAINYLGPKEAVDAARCVEQGKVFTLQTRMCDPAGDPVSPDRPAPRHLVVRDKAHYLAGKADPAPGGLEYADDLILTPLHGTTHCDALGHAWVGDRIWNNREATSTIGGLSFASVLPIASRGIVGRGILLDMARHRGKDRLDRGETFSHSDLLACARAQGIAINRRDVLVIRTGWMGLFYGRGPAEWQDEFPEPGLTYSPELIRWFHATEIPVLVTDTTANEVLVEASTGVQAPLHVALMTNLGVALIETAWLEELASDCESDGRYEFLFAAAPLKVVGGSGAPVNPLAIK
jgi:kynurenine formamidase